MTPTTADATTTQPIRTVGDDFPVQQARVREILGHYREIGPAGLFGAALIEQILRRADAAMAGGDLVEILRSYEELKGVKG